MKKILFLATVTALAFTACTSDELVVQNTQQATTEQGVGFDVYVPGATAQTRSGRVNVMTNGILQQTGFGIFGYQSNGEATDGSYVAGDKPDFMWNQQVSFNTSAAGWYYAPLKYWPNETNDDSQTTPTQAAGMPNQTSKNNLDRLTFFAYAPWVQANQTSGEATALNTNIETVGVGIKTVTNNEGKLEAVYDTYIKDPTIAYTVATDPDNSVDLLWGVAPSGGLSYTSVSTTNKTVTIPEGMPLIDLIKPAVNTNLKFMFQHALARLGLKVVLAADQVASGGYFDYGNTKVTIDKIEISGNFGTGGYLSLNNTTANVANWVAKNKADGSNAANPVLTIDATHGLAEHLRYDAAKNTSHAQQEVTGVTTTLADAIQVRSKYDANYSTDCATEETAPDYSATRPYFAAAANIATPTYANYNNFNKAANTTYFHKYVTNQGVSYTDITSEISTTYPKATVWENPTAIFSTATANIRKVVASGASAVEVNLADAATFTAYRKSKAQSKTYYATGQPVQVGDYVFYNGTSEVTNLTAVEEPSVSSTPYWAAKPNYFMVIPTNSSAQADRTLKVKITYYVSTTDASLKDGIVYTKNEVEKDIVLPHLKNGVAYNLKLILGLTSVKVEAEVADWVTTEGVVNLPQNTSE